MADEIQMSVKDTLIYINDRVQQSIKESPSKDKRTLYSGQLVLQDYKLRYQYEFSVDSEGFFYTKKITNEVPVELLNTEKVEIKGGEGLMSIVIPCSSNVACSKEEYSEVKEHCYEGECRKRYSDRNSQQYRFKIVMGSDVRLLTKVQNAVTHLLKIAREEHKSKDRSDPF